MLLLNDYEKRNHQTRSLTLTGHFFNTDRSVCDPDRSFFDTDRSFFDTGSGHLNQDRVDPAKTTQSKGRSSEPTYSTHLPAFRTHSRYTQVMTHGYNIHMQAHEYICW